MFVRVSPVLLLGLALVVSSCGGSSPAPGATQDAAAVDQSKPAGVILVQDTGLWTIDSDTAKWKAALTVGEVVYWGGQTKTALIEKTGDRDFVSVSRSDGSEGWVIKLQIAQAAKPAVVVADKTLLYTQPKNTNVSSKGLLRGTILAVANEGGSENFYKVSVYDPTTKAYISDQYLRKEDVSLDDADVQSAIQLSLALVAKTDDQKTALLSSALKDYPKSQFAFDIGKILNPGDYIQPGTVPVTEKIGSNYAANEDTKIYDFPDPSGKVVGNLSKGTNVYAAERTAQTVSMDGREDHWYKITDPAEGWVFGASLTENAGE